MPTTRQLWEQRGWLATITLLGFVAGAAFGLVFLPPVYVARAQVVVRLVSDDTSKPAEPTDPTAMATERELVSADDVVHLVQRRTGWPGSPADLRRPLGVSVVGGTETMTIAYRADDPERARVGAQAFAESYLADRSSRAAAARDSSRQNLQAALRTATDRVGRLRASLATTAAGAQAATELLFQEAAP